MKLPKRRALWLLLIPVVPILILGALNPTNIATTRPDDLDARLRTRRYRASLLELRQAVERVVPKLKTYGRAWKFQDPKLAPEGAKLGTLILRIEVPVVVFTDDLQVVGVEDKARGEVEVNVWSRSRVGKGDFGENQRHVLQMLQALDEQLKTKAAAS